ncbi:low-density lipoprotein receptor, putative [Ixodes scapularis]|uniref:Low-density lipoprotein receptor, putative n=1 Tax=Ixodes scapularis TaxID=6945 RepID=B7PUU1_IXOSC|nr:low-density lipoprotein receptor, putative [Ixodes scapularis]|eukprot:XP_002406799.1 low-density lipoprotein receptor, putative [Ixodes scapularis]
MKWFGSVKEEEDKGGEGGRSKEVGKLGRRTDRGERKEGRKSGQVEEEPEGREQGVTGNDKDEEEEERPKVQGLENVRTLVSGGFDCVEGLAVDWIACNLYWVESKHQEIEVSRCDGSLRASVVGDVRRPRGLALDPRVGLLFWTDWEDDNPRIERSLLDGSARQQKATPALICLSPAMESAFLKIASTSAFLWVVRILCWCSYRTIVQ